MKPHSAQPNRLAKEKSPYLLQHAQNPVDWYPWGEEAFEKARRENKPIFLSIGYSTCHWCHVMERESFENPEIAALMNQHFVSIKVDREERPDVDALYMQAVQQMTGRGGWPMAVFLTPELKPFYGGTYFPPEDRWGQPGFRAVLRSVAQTWEQRRQEILDSSQAMVESLRQQAPPPSAGRPDEALFQHAFEIFSDSYDDRYGGFAPAPKFPRPHALSFLLRYWKRTGNPQALAITEHTLRAMADGGLWDHAGGGFHRYSTDPQWHVPHFEKMLYDQALLARTYLEAAQATGKPEYAATARGIFEYVLRDMASSAGGFYSAEDADSEEHSVPGTEAVPGTVVHKKEGAFYVWTAAELKTLLGEQPAEIFGYIFGIQEHGNAEQDPTGEFAGKNILHRVRTVQEAAQKFGKSEKEITQTIDRARPILFETRKQRPRPYRDDKVLTDWNGLMIGALALGSRVLEEPRYAEAARRSADFILKKLTRPDGRLLHRWRDGEAAIPAHLEDYAFLVQGLADLYEATFEVRYLAAARRLTEEMLRLFWDDSAGGFFLTGIDAEALLIRQKEVYDGAIPSGNSMGALDLLRMGRFTGSADWEKKAGRLLEHFSGALQQNPSAYPQLLVALDFLLGPSSEIVLAAAPQDPALPTFARELFRRFIPNRIVVFHPEGKEAKAVEQLAPFTQGQAAQGGKVTAYVCRNYTCSLPSTSLEQFRQRLDE